MTPTRTIAATAAKQAIAMLASAIILVTIGETLNWFLCWNEARKL